MTVFTLAETRGKSDSSNEKPAPLNRGICVKWYLNELYSVLQINYLYMSSFVYKHEIASFLEKNKPGLYHQANSKEIILIVL